MTSVAHRGTARAAGRPGPVHDAATAEQSPAWRELKTTVAQLRELQVKDGSVPVEGDHPQARACVAGTIAGIRALAPSFPHDQVYLDAVVHDLDRWAGSGFGVPDFHDSLVAFQPQLDRRDARRHLVLFPTYTQNCSTDRLFEAVLIELIWPDVVAALEERYSNPLFLPIRFIDFTAGYDTNSAVLFPEAVAVRETPPFTWGGIFADREAARFRTVVREAAAITRLEVPEPVQRLLRDQSLAERAFVVWDLIHDRSHMRGDLPFDPFMIKQRMPYFLYSLEELRCDLTAFRAAAGLARAADTGDELRELAELAQYAIVFDRIFRFPLTGGRVRNYDGLGGQLLFAWLHQRGVLNWTDSRLSLDWAALPDVVVELSDQINQLYWRSIDRPKTAHWLAAYDLVSATLTPHPASHWSRGLPTEVLAGPPKGFTDAVLDDEFPLSMFYEALNRKLGPVIESTRGIRAR